VAKTAPFPVFRTFTQSRLYWLSPSKPKAGSLGTPDCDECSEAFQRTAVITNVEIVVPFLPEMLRIADQPPRHALLQRFQRRGKRLPLRFAHQNMNVFRHHDVSVNAKLETSPHSFQRSLEHSPLRVCRKQRATMVAAECHEMTVSGLVKTLQSPRHRRSLCLHKSPLKPKTGLNGPPVHRGGLNKTQDWFSKKPQDWVFKSLHILTKFAFRIKFVR